MLRKLSDLTKASFKEREICVSRQNCVFIYILCIALPIKATFVHVWRRLFSHLNINNAIFISKHRHSLPFNLTGFLFRWKIGELQNLIFFMADKCEFWFGAMRCVCFFTLHCIVAVFLCYAKPWYVWTMSISKAVKWYNA